MNQWKGVDKKKLPMSLEHFLLPGVAQRVVEEYRSAEAAQGGSTNGTAQPWHCVGQDLPPNGQAMKSGAQKGGVGKKGQEGVWCRLGLSEALDHAQTAWKK